LPQGGDAQITGEFVNNSDKPDTLRPPGMSGDSVS